MTLIDIAVNIAGTVTLIGFLLLCLSLPVIDCMKENKYMGLFVTTGIFMALVPVTWVAAAIVGIWS